MNPNQARQLLRDRAAPIPPSPAGTRVQLAANGQLELVDIGGKPLPTVRQILYFTTLGPRRCRSLRAELKKKAAASAHAILEGRDTQVPS